MLDATKLGNLLKFPWPFIKTKDSLDTLRIIMQSYLILFTFVEAGRMIFNERKWAQSIFCILRDTWRGIRMRTCRGGRNRSKSEMSNVSQNTFLSFLKFLLPVTIATWTPIKVANQIPWLDVYFPLSKQIVVFCLFIVVFHFWVLFQFLIYNF